MIVATRRTAIAPAGTAGANRCALLPLRSLRALVNPEIAAGRFARMSTSVLRCERARVVVECLSIDVERRRRSAVAAPTYQLDLGFGDTVFGAVEVDAADECWTASRQTVRDATRLLGEHVAIHVGAGAVPRRLRGAAVSSLSLHALNNGINTLAMQMTVVRALLEQGKADEAAYFAARCAEVCDQVSGLVRRVRAT